MHTPLYLSNTYLFCNSASIIMADKDDKGSYLMLDQTIFYPQGGGQPSDQGCLYGQDFTIQIDMVRQFGKEIRHYYTYDNELKLTGAKVSCAINQERRLLNARYHTAAHLIGNVVEGLHSNLKAIKGHSFPNEAYVEFAQQNELKHDQDFLDQHIIEAEVANSINSALSTEVFMIDREAFEQQFYPLPYYISGNKTFRVIQIKGFPPVPCGGTHLSAINEIGIIVINKIKIKNGIVKISYEVK